ncbi:MAG: cation-transporting P-type ATPase [Planctomycetota bacterium]|nr:cation-transporting P-type ATPase [Planctomycetota bacterium]
MLAKDRVGAAAPWSAPAENVLTALGVTREQGLRSAEIRRRRRRHGPNVLRERKPQSAWDLLIHQLRSLIVALLAAAALLSFLFGDTVEAIAIAAVLVINTALGFFAELRAVRSMEALRRLGHVRTRVRRNGAAREVPAAALVPGDIVLLEGGDVVTADLRLVEASRVRADESALTGESVPVGKAVEPAGVDAPLHDRSSMLFKGTAVTRGSAEGVVVATGMATQLGRIAGLVDEAEAEVTPLERRLEALGRKLILLTVGIAILTAVLGILAGEDLVLMIETGVALAVAAIPEGLPIVATIALARGMWRMARRNVLVNRLSAVEVLGAATVIFTDKTGTLTENRLSLASVALHGGDVALDVDDLPPLDPALRTALRVGVLCTNAEVRGESNAVTGDPLEVALLEAARRFGLERETLLAEHPEVAEEAFDATSRMMATTHRDGETLLVVVKGAADAVLDVCSRVRTDGGDVEITAETRAAWRERDDALARAGYRVLAAAEKSVSAAEEPYAGLTLLGLFALLDPPREDVRASVEACTSAGIRIVMVTGDQAGTARNVAHAVGITESEDATVVEGRAMPATVTGPDAERLRAVSLFARVAPEQKLALIQLHQEAGEIVAMTGDGVNDAPALQKADIGVAMGRRGTQVAREAADMVLKDDAFASIVAAVRHGRIIFGNIRKFVIYLLSCNVSEIMIVTGAALVQAPLPLLPLQILFLNLVTDVFPALALALGEGDETVMEQPPRPPDEGILGRRHWHAIIGFGALITFAVMLAFVAAFQILGLGRTEAVTISFLTVAFAQLWHVFNVRSPGSSFLRNEVTRNPWVWGALVLCVVLVLLAVYTPALASLLQITPPDAAGWLLVFGASLVPWLVGQLVRRRTSES